MQRMNMKSTIYTPVLLMGLIVSMVVFLPARMPLAHAGNACSGVPKPSGVYGLAVEGFNDGGQQGSFTIDNFYPLSGAGTFIFTPSSPDAFSGTVSRHLFVSFGGAVVSPPISDSGPYSQNPDCTFSATFADVGEVWNLITVQDGRQIKFFVNAPGSAVAGTMIRQRSSNRREEE
jgi:hypothetical protein